MGLRQLNDKSVYISREKVYKKARNAESNYMKMNPSAFQITKALLAEKKWSTALDRRLKTSKFA